MLMEKDGDGAVKWLPYLKVLHMFQMTMGSQELLEFNRRSGVWSLWSVTEKPGLEGLCPISHSQWKEWQDQR